MLAAQNGQIGALALIKARANFQAQENGGFTALMTRRIKVMISAPAR